MTAQAQDVGPVLPSITERWDVCLRIACEVFGTTRKRVESAGRRDTNDLWARYAACSALWQWSTESAAELSRVIGLEGRLYSTLYRADALEFGDKGDPDPEYAAKAAAVDERVRLAMGADMAEGQA